MIADVLRRWATPGWRWSHFPAGEHRHITTAARLKRMGLQPGWPDFILLSPHIDEDDPAYQNCQGAHFLELKRAGARTLSPEQHEFFRWCIRNSYRYECTNDFKEAVETLKDWGAVRASVRA